MTPTIQDGETVLYDPRAYRRAPPTVGDIVVIVNPTCPAEQLIKRVSAVQLSGATTHVEVRGDNGTASNDSRHFGPLRLDQVRGRVTSRFLPDFAAAAPPP